MRRVLSATSPTAPLTAMRPLGRGMNQPFAGPRRRMAPRRRRMQQPPVHHPQNRRPIPAHPQPPRDQAPRAARSSGSSWPPAEPARKRWRTRSDQVRQPLMRPPCPDLTFTYLPVQSSKQGSACPYYAHHRRKLGLGKTPIQARFGAGSGRLEHDDGGCRLGDVCENKDRPASMAVAGRSFAHRGALSQPESPVGRARSYGRSARS